MYAQDTTGTYPILLTLQGTTSITTSYTSYGNGGSFYIDGAKA